MGNSEINKIINNRLYDHEVKMDHDALWNAIQRKQNNKFPIIMLTSSLLVLVFSMSFMYINLETDGPMQIEPSVAVMDLTHSLESKKAEETKSVSEEKVSVTKKALVSKNASKAQNNIDRQVQTKEKKSITDNQIDLSLLTAKGEDAKKAPLAAHSILISKEEIQNEAIEKTQEVYGEKAETLLRTTHTGFTVDHLRNHLALLDFQRSVLEWPKRKKPIGCFDHRLRKNTFAIEVYGGPGLISKKMVSNVATYQELVNRRKESETSLESLRAGVHLRFNHHTGLYAKAGVELGRLRERLDHSIGSDTTYTLENQIIDWEINNNGDSIPIFGSQTITMSSFKRWKIFNEFRTTDIPVLIGYRQNVGALDYYIEAGAIFNVGLTKKGMILENGTQTPSDLEPFFQDNSGTHLTLGVGASYNITESVYVFASPNLKWSMRDLNSENYPIAQRFHSYSLLIGVGYEFRRGPKTL